jgi:AcrR family transcriptional regulator
LSKERILAEALQLVDERGLAGLTTRRLGIRLGCEAMSIYHHFPGKQHLLDAMVARAYAGIREPAADLDPIARLRFIVREYRAMAQRHPRLFPLIAVHRTDTPAGVAYMERLRRHIRAVLPDDRLAAQASRIFGHYVTGAALDEASGCAAERGAGEPAAGAFITGEPSPLAAAAPFPSRAHAEGTFDLGLEMLLDGIARLRLRLPADSPTPPKPIVRPKH